MITPNSTSVSALWQTDFTVDNLIDYARASVELRVLDKNTEGFADRVASRRLDIEANLRRLLDSQLINFRETVERLKPYTPLDKQTTRILAEPRVLAVHSAATVDVSSSHLVRVTLPEPEIASVMRDVERELAEGKDVLDDDWFR